MKNERSITQGQTFDIVVRSRQATFFNGAVSAISSVNIKGPFDVLPRHIHFISLIREYILIQKQNGQTERIVFTDGVIKVKDNKVEVYIDTGK